MEALPNYRASPVFSETEKLVLEYVDAMTETPVEVSEALFAKLRGNFTEAQLVELTATIAWENFRARFDHAFGVEAEGFSQGSFCAAPARKSFHASSAPSCSRPLQFASLVGFL